jgi:monofunctional biosynthetic peptidoglycan transglycosylase
MAADFLFRLVTPGNGVFVSYQWTDWDDISPNMGLAVIAAEDQKFPFHHGFDLESISDALEANKRGRRLRGASTISQQVAKNLFLWKGRSFIRKGLEAYFALLLESLWPKERILEVYVNIAEFGDGVYGVTEASRVFFGKEPSKLTKSNAALLASVLPNPKRFRVKRPSGYVYHRRSWIRRQMIQLGGTDYLDEM